MEQKLIGKMTGYKATDKDMCCQGFQFELNEWYEIDKETPLILCKQGFHFCQQPSGVWAYYSEQDARVFEIEAEDILDAPFESGAAFKRVCRRIRLIKEISLTGDGNTGGCNTGDGNTGYRNTGDGNTGDYNTGDGNTGYCNTGDGNTGDYNTGNRNTGYRNTGDCNTGDGNTGYCNTGGCNTGGCNTGDGNTGNCNTGGCNTGDGNTGDYNTGNRNTGYCNTGDGNACNFSSGYFCSSAPPVIIFDEPTQIKRENLPFDLMGDLYNNLIGDEDFDIEPFLAIPNATAEKIRTLHEKHKKLRA